MLLRNRSDGFLTNVLEANAVHIRQAASDTKMPVVIGEKSVEGPPGTVGVYTEQPRLEHGPFWQRYEELKKGE